MPHVKIITRRVEPDPHSPKRNSTEPNRTSTRAKGPGFTRSALGFLVRFVHVSVQSDYFSDLMMIMDILNMIMMMYESYDRSIPCADQHGGTLRCRLSDF